MTIGDINVDYSALYPTYAQPNSSQYYPNTNPINSAGNTSPLFSGNPGTVGDNYTQPTNSAQTADGVDDGKISFWDKLKNFGKGLISPITNLFSSPGNFLKGAAMIAGGALLMVATGGAAAPLMVAAGVGFGAFQFGKGALNAMGAKTDAEAEEAWQEIGGGTAAVGLSVLGAKAAAKAGGLAGSENMNALQATRACLKPGNIASSFSKSWTNLTTSGWANIKNMFGGKKTTAKAADDAPENTTKTELSEDAKLTQEAKAKAEANSELKASTPENSNSPQNELYQLADDTTLTPEEYAARGQAQVDKFNQKVSKSDLDYIDKRIERATTPAAKKALIEQRKIMADQLGETAPAKITQASDNSTAATTKTTNNPQNELYQLADDTTLTPEEYAARGQAQVDKFNQKVSKSDLDYIDKRIERATTPAAKKALIEQRKIMADQLGETAPAKITQASDNSTALASKNSQSPQNEIYKLVDEITPEEYAAAKTTRPSQVDKFNNRGAKTAEIQKATVEVTGNATEVPKTNVKSDTVIREETAASLKKLFGKVFDGSESISTAEAQQRLIALEQDLNQIMGLSNPTNIAPKLFT